MISFGNHTRCLCLLRKLTDQQREEARKVVAALVVEGIVAKADEVLIEQVQVEEVLVIVGLLQVIEVVVVLVVRELA